MDCGFARGNERLLKLAHIQGLFPTPLATFHVDDADALNRELLAEIARRREAEEGSARSNRQGWHSAYDLFKRKEKAQAKLAGIIREAVTQATMKLAPNSDLGKLQMECDGWINVNPTGAYNTPHDHPGNLWSGAYYVAMPAVGEGDTSSGSIEFIDTRASLATSLIKAPFTGARSSLQPKPGTLLLFPANVVHWVHPNTSTEDRVTIAFNARFSPRGAAAKRK